MDSVRVAVDLPANSVVKVIKPVFAAGPQRPVTYSFVNGKFGIDNSKFVITPDGEIKNIAILATGVYNVRYRVDAGASFIENPLKIYTQDYGVTITSNDAEYSDSIVPGTTVGTVALSSGSLSDVSIYPLSASDDPQNPAMEYDGAGDINWTGNQSSGVEYSYDIVYTGQCLKSNKSAVYTPSEITDAVSISQPIDSIFDVDANKGRVQGSATSLSPGQDPYNDWLTQRAAILAGNGGLSTPSGCLSLKVAGPIATTNIYWDWRNYDLSSLDPTEPLALRVGTNITTSGGRTDYTCYICYYSGAWAEDGADIVNWSKLRVTNPNDLNTAGLYYDVSVLFSLADTTNVWIAILDDFDVNTTDLNVSSPCNNQVLSEVKLWGTLL